MRHVVCICGVEFETSHQHKRFCSTLCKREYRRAYERDYQAAPLNRERRRANQVERTYRLSAERYAEILDAQGGGCAICGGTNDTDRALAVDHDHATGEIRGLLCDRHNAGIGMFWDNVEDLLAAVSYLMTPTTRDPRFIDGSLISEARRRASKQG